VNLNNRVVIYIYILHVCPPIVEMAEAVKIYLVLKKRKVIVVIGLKIVAPMMPKTGYFPVMYRLIISTYILRFSCLKEKLCQQKICI
jgi:hypothetical protein